MINYYSNNRIRYNDEEENPKELPDNPMEKMMAGWQFDKKFIEQRKVFLWGVVDDKSAKDITARLLYLEAIDSGKEITFYINSPGGMVTSGMVIYDTMQMIKSPVSTCVHGNGRQAWEVYCLVEEKKENVIFFPNGEVMIHQPSGGGPGYQCRP
jgi:ATP-dependent Clp protease protease subunit